MPPSNGLVCFTNCLLPLEDGSLVEKDLWIDERQGTILDAQKTFFIRQERPDRIIDLGGNILSPGLLDIQLNGAYGFDFSVYEGDDDAYRAGMQLVAEKIVETGVTALVPTLITQEKSLYPKLLSLLKPFSTANSATLLGWHAEGPFLEYAKRGAHVPSFLLAAPDGIKSFEEVYGAENLADSEDWLMSTDRIGVRMITAAPEIEGVMQSIGELDKRGIVFSIGHSVATSDIATGAVQHGARLITHLFNAMPQLHHRDPSIIGLLGASPHLSSSFSPITAHYPSLPPYNPVVSTSPVKTSPTGSPPVKALSRAASTSSSTRSIHAKSEAFDDSMTPPQTPVLAANRAAKFALPELHLEKGQIADMEFERPFYGLIVDGIHSHPNSVRLAFSAYPEGCILITDAMKILDPNLKDGIHEWRDGQRFVKEGDKLYLEGTNTLAGSVVTLDKCIRNFSRFTGCSLGEAIKCATYNPAKCLGIEHKKGTLRPGADADLVVLDRQGNVVSTWVKGMEVWNRPQAA
ncbi:Metallo-dependent hydrolase [Pleurotus eryngii]|uniref:Metallo-dependent hydrolase n=1 Tax=Pleurotus eryngii TaxID=5323 RepID=A0A9P6DK45_PLEER|nr:Metallo-dependent hydrolase [Pleurotus eryngii]